MKKPQRKKYNYNRIMKEVLLNDEVYSWVALYNELGVMDWFKERDVVPDVKYIFMSQPMVQYISFVLEDKYVVGKHRPSFTDKFVRRRFKWDAFNYSPCEIDESDCLILDLTGKTRENISKEYKTWMPDLKKE